MRLAEAARHGSLWQSGKYPPVFPWLLVLPQAFFGLALMPQKILVFLFYLASAFLLLRRAERHLPGRWGAPVAWAAMTIPAVLEYGHYVMSEVPYLFFSLVALDAAERAALPAGSGARARSIVLAGLAAAATFYTRSVGLSLWVAVGAWLLLSPGPSRRAKSLFAGLSAALLLPWGLRSILGPENPYFRQLVLANPFLPELGNLDAAGWAGRIGENTRIYLFGEIPTSLLPILLRSTYAPPELRYHFLPWFAAIVPLALLALGLIAAVRGREPTGLYVLLYLLLNLLWPSLWTGLRFLVPILPLLSLLLFRGLFAVFGILPLPFGMPGRPRRLRPRPRFAAAFLAVWIALAARQQVALASEVRRYPPDWDAYFRAAAWLKEHAAAGDTIADRKPAMLTYVTGRRAVAFPRETDPAAMLRWMDREGVDWVVVPAIPYDDISRYLIPAVQAEQDRFEPAFEIEEPYTVVLRLLPAREGR